eukprot:gnl/Dysnectes_brevis/2662_a3219_1773.p1 GENE.gnl/Dysnectes_brevis/2662_a3219_1773~~gnl/Dysnectes_brevis/2662_a3219_1773.p1  ORF type:complete len:178 (-),score=23.28 gnl/Dysnectes_brevis/2662_a3219_1773:47-580(-)
MEHSLTDHIEPLEDYLSHTSLDGIAFDVELSNETERGFVFNLTLDSSRETYPWPEDDELSTFTVVLDRSCGIPNVHVLDFKRLFHPNVEITRGEVCQATLQNCSVNPQGKPVIYYARFLQLLRLRLSHPDWIKDDIVSAAPNPDAARACLNGTWWETAQTWLVREVDLEDQMESLGF